MKRLVITTAGATAMSLAGSLFSVIAVPAFVQSVTASEVQSVTFEIENMTCALCPVTVRKAMEGVEGVRSVEIDFDARTARVVFDPAITTSESIAAASANAGYPARPAS
jgi:mercuric ion binding protein